MYDPLPFAALNKKANDLGESVARDLGKLQTVMRDIEELERHEMWEAARGRGNELLIILLGLTQRAQYVLDVIDAQGIGNQSEAWSVGVRHMRESLSKVKELYDA